MTGRTALFVGDVSFDLTMTVSHMPEPDEKVHASTAVESPGGVAANAAVACALAGTPTRLVIGVGDDVVGRMLLDRLKTTVVEVLSSSNPGSTCRVVVLVEPHGEKRLLLYPGVSLYPTRRQLAALSLDDIGWVHTAVYDNAAAALLIDQCRTQALSWSLDLEPSTFPDGLDRLRNVVVDAAVVFCNARSMARIGGNAVKQLLEMGAKTVVETQGADGATLHGAEGHTKFPAPQGSAVDTTGAGDCLAGWFIAERLRGTGPEEALKTAVVAATISCARLGAQSSYPTRQDVVSMAT
ncbi:MAG: carbohydrate kinase family protein [Proteobacteria bacterium]|nr:carbohydrate kinase family protein [Pseudomonadota bacterium]